MAAPAVLAGISIGSTALGAVTQAMGSAQAGQAQSQMYQYQAAVSAMNKQLADQNASYAVAAGEVQAQEEGLKTRAEIGQTRAAKGASGLEVGSGSATAVVQSEQQIGQFGEAIIRSDAAKRAYGYEVEGAQATAQGQVYTAAATQAKTASEFSVAGSILGGAASVSSKWLQGQQTGIFS